MSIKSLLGIDPDQAVHLIIVQWLRRRQLMFQHGKIGVRNIGADQECARQMRDSGVDAQAHLLQGAIAEKIVQEADRLGADIVVLGTHRSGAIHRLFLGSVSRGVVQHASCPILLVPLATENLPSLTPND